MSQFHGDDDDDDSDEARKMKNKKKKKPQVELVQYEKPEVYELVDDSADDIGHGYGGIGHHHGFGLHKIKKHGRSIGGLLCGRCIGTFRYSILSPLYRPLVLFASIEMRSLRYDE